MITEKELERVIKTQEANFVGRKTRKFHSGGKKIRNASDNSYIKNSV